MFHHAGYRALEYAAKQNGLNFQLVCAIVAAESEWNPWHVRAEDPKLKRPFKPEKFSEELSINIQTEASLQLHRWGIMGVPGYLARQYGYREPLQTLCGPTKNVEIGCMILADLMKKMGLESYGISAWAAGEFYTEKRMRNPGFVTKVLARLRDLRHPEP